MGGRKQNQTLPLRQTVQWNNTHCGDSTGNMVLLYLEESLTMTKIGIVGTTHLNQNQEQMVDMICDGILGRWQTIENNPTFVSGGAEGVDKRAEMVADQY